MPSPVRMGVRVSLSDRGPRFLTDDSSELEDESSHGWSSPPMLSLRASQFVELADGQRVAADFETEMMFGFSGNVDFTGQYQLDLVRESLRDAIFEDAQRQREIRTPDDQRWKELIAKLTEAGLAGTTKDALKALPCFVEFDEEVARQVGVQADGPITRPIEALAAWRTESPPPDLERAIELISSDLEPGGAAGITLSVEPGREDDDAWMVYVQADKGGGGGSGFVLDRPFPALVATLAGMIQDHVIDEIWGEWPACPHHGHPLDAEADDRTSWWVCRSNPESKWAIGSLGSDGDYVTAIRRQS
jgi:hypothetical protein